ALPLGYQLATFTKINQVTALTASMSLKHYTIYKAFKSSQTYTTSFMLNNIFTAANVHNTKEKKAIIWLHITELNEILESTKQSNEELLLPVNSNQQEQNNTKDDAHMVLEETEPNH
ncbi:22951_t:CDS:2, partial [Cetraspora pellucida]